ncbi:MAG: hypothetical protein NWE91_01550 [Candidatus Bathyarchaeota archaeon]|nr:hypothetical protein [Candidatus Bathyarchaeota archaeon]
MNRVCTALDKNPDQLIDELKTSPNTTAELENIHKKVTIHLKVSYDLILRTIDTYFERFHAFCSTNGIEISLKETPDLLRRLRTVNWETYLSITHRN